MKNSKIELFDTTLRDGTQGEGINLSVEDKIRLAMRLDTFGINIIEGGWPGSNPRDKEFFKKIRSVNLNQAEICAFGSTARKLAKIEKDPNLLALLETEVDTITIFGKTWQLHSKQGLGISDLDNAKLIEKSVDFLSKNGVRVIFDAEHFFDGYKQSQSFSFDMLNAAVNGGADTLVLCDTNGGSLPNFIYDVTSKVVNRYSVPIGIHSHNDSGLAGANTLMAVSAGALHVQGTINGVGERCGNVSLATVIPNLVLKMNKHTKTELNLSELSSLVNFTYDIMNIHPDTQAPFIGQSAFAHKGGIHVSAVMKDSNMYEHIKPELVGNKQRVLVSDLSGKSNISFKANELNIKFKNSKEITSKLVSEIKALEFEGYQFEAADASLELILRRLSGEYRPFFKVLDSKVHISFDENGNENTDATLKVLVGEDIEHTASDGEGPVDALNKALRKALSKFFPELKDVRLTDYKVRVLNEQEGTSAKVRVLIESAYGNESWSTIGVSKNIIEASRQALSDSFNFRLASLSNWRKVDNKELQLLK